MQAVTVVVPVLSLVLKSFGGTGGGLGIMMNWLSTSLLRSFSRQVLKSSRMMTSVRALKTSAIFQYGLMLGGSQPKKGQRGVFKLEILPVNCSQAWYDAREDVDDCEDHGKEHCHEHDSEARVPIDQFSDGDFITGLNDIEE